LSGVIVFFALGDDDAPETAATPSLATAVDDAGPAARPFDGLTEGDFRVGNEDLLLVIADEEDERYQGLRERETIGPYDGMLFAYDDSDTHSFTMSTVPVALDIAFYDGDGKVVNRFRMEPCPSGNDCPSYPSEREFVYAIETLAGELPEGRLTST
jgi:uncharacterized membrane protein (UPF0127 family)